jgi:hypothetical protein
MNTNTSERTFRLSPRDRHDIASLDAAHTSGLLPTATVPWLADTYDVTEPTIRAAIREEGWDGAVWTLASISMALGRIGATIPPTVAPLTDAKILAAGEAFLVGMVAKSQAKAAAKARQRDRHNTMRSLDRLRKLIRKTRAAGAA